MERTKTGSAHFKSEKKFFSKTKLFITLIVFGMGVGGWVTTVEISLAAGKKKDSSQDQEISELKKIAKGLHNISQQNAKILSKVSGQLEVMLTVMGVTNNDSLKNHWVNMPKELKIDIFGNPVINFEWLVVSDDYLVATKYKWISPDSIFTKIEWDERTKVNR